MPDERGFQLSAGEFRGLVWQGGPDTAVLLHGLSGMADVWTAMVAALAAQGGSVHGGEPPSTVGTPVSGTRPCCIAIDQRGHGRSPHTPGSYRAVDYLGDLVELVEGLERPVRLVGHSMGARVAMLAAARHPGLFSSVVIVDIGPEAWQRNIESTMRLLSARPETFADRDEALAVARFIVGDRGESAAEAMVDDRLRRMPDGSYEWLAPREALEESVVEQRSRNYWRDWEHIAIPALLVRGGESDELRPRIVDEMRRRNPTVDVVEIDGVGHNVPMLAPVELARTVMEFWQARG